MEILSEIFEVVKRAHSDVTFESRCIVHNDEEVAWILHGSITLCFDDVQSSVIDCILAYLGSKPQRELNFSTSLDLDVYFDTVVRRVFYELGTEKVLVISGEATVWTSCNYLRSEFVPKWCTQLFMVLKENMQPELARSVVELLFYRTTI